MKFDMLVSCAAKALSAIKIGGKKNPKLGRLDFAILEVAMMVAALDGEILKSETDAFMALARKCRGYTPDNAKKCLDAALQKAGYLMAIAKIGRYTAKERVAAFVASAVATMPRGFVDGELSDLRRAFVLWISMGLSDGEFSDIERTAIDALQDRLAQVMFDEALGEEARWIALYPAYGMANAAASRAKKVSLLEPGFVDKAAGLVRDLSSSARRDAATAALEAFIREA